MSNAIETIKLVVRNDITKFFNYAAGVSTPRTERRMNTYATVEGAYEVHRSIPRAYRQSATPRAWGSGIALRSRQLPGDIVERLRQCQLEMSSGPLSGFTSIGTIIRSLLATGLPPMGSEEPAIHDDLQRVFASGGIPENHGFQTLASVEHRLRRARELGYATKRALIKFRPDTEAEANMFEAARDVVTRRISPTVLFFTSRFVVPDPVAKRPTAHIFDQLWLSRDEYRPNSIRAIALQVETEASNPRAERVRDRLLAMMGYEVVHASAHWSRVDPQRVMRDACDIAGMPILDRFRRSYPGEAIDAYRCAFRSWGAPMIRTPSGYGIVEHNDQFFHEQCFDAAVNSGQHPTSTEPNPSYLK
jgi:hypothetical protein